MTIPKLIDILKNKVAALKSKRVVLHQLGDLNEVVAIDNEVAETEATIASLTHQLQENQGG
jgi:hypothetical protein